MQILSTYVHVVIVGKIPNYEPVGDKLRSLIGFKIHRHSHKLESQELYAYVLIIIYCTRILPNADYDDIDHDQQ